MCTLVNVKVCLDVFVCVFRSLCLFMSSFLYFFCVHTHTTHAQTQQVRKKQAYLSGFTVGSVRSAEEVSVALIRALLIPLSQTVPPSPRQSATPPPRAHLCACPVIASQTTFFHENAPFRSLFRACSVSCILICTSHFCSLQ